MYHVAACNVEVPSMEKRDSCVVRRDLFPWIKALKGPRTSLKEKAMEGVVFNPVFQECVPLSKDTRGRACC